MFINTHVGRFVGCESQPVALMAGGIASLKSLIQSYTAGVLCEGVPACVSPWPFFLWDEEEMTKTSKEGANKRGNSSRLTQSFHFFMFEPIFSPVNALNQPI